MDWKKRVELVYGCLFGLLDREGDVHCLTDGMKKLTDAQFLALYKACQRGHAERKTTAELNARKWQE